MTSGLGDLERAPDGAWRLRFTRLLPHARAEVWRAIDTPEGLSAWFPSTIEGERRPGARLQFGFPAAAGVEPIDGEMLAYEPPHLIEFRWGTDRIRIELREQDGATELTLLDTLEDVGKGARDGAGWHTCLDALAASLAGDREARQRLEGWAPVLAVYQRRFGPRASRIGPPDR